MVFILFIRQEQTYITATILFAGMSGIGPAKEIKIKVCILDILLFGPRQGSKP